MCCDWDIFPLRGADGSNSFTLLYQIANFTHIHKNTASLCMDHPLCTVPANNAGDAGIGDSASLPNDPSKPVAAFGLHHGVHVLPSNKAGTEGNGQRCHIPAGAKVPLSQNGVYHDIRLCSGNTGSLRVNEHRNSALRPDRLRLL